MSTIEYQADAGRDLRTASLEPAAAAVANLRLVNAATEALRRCDALATRLPIGRSWRSELREAIAVAARFYPNAAEGGAGQNPSHQEGGVVPGQYAPTIPDVPGDQV